MHSVVHAIDKPGAFLRRMERIDAHRAHLDQVLAAPGVCVLLSCPITTDDCAKMCGGFPLRDAPDRRTVERVFGDDLLATSDIWERLTISRDMIRQNTMGARPRPQA